MAMADEGARVARGAGQHDVVALALALGALVLPLGGLMIGVGFFAGSTAGIGDYASLAGGAANVVGPLLLTGALALLVSGGHPGTTMRRWAQLAVVAAGALTCLVLVGVVLRVLFGEFTEPFTVGRTPGPVALGAADQVLARGPGMVLYGSGAVMAACTAWWASTLPMHQSSTKEPTDG